MLLLTLNRKWPLPLPQPPWRSLMSCLMARSSQLAMKGSGALRPSSSLPSWEWNPAESMKLFTTQS